MKKLYYLYIPAAVVILGLLYFLSINDFDRSSKIISATVIAVMALAFYALNERQKRLDRASGIPVDDEMTIKIKVYAGSRAFHISMILWCIIFIFSDVFTNPRTMIGIGILGSAATYGICLLYSRLTQNFSHSNNQ